MTRARQTLAWLLVVVAVACATFAALSTWARREFFDSARVAGAVRSTVTVPAVHDALVEEIVAQVASDLPPAAAPSLPLVRDEVDALVGSDAFGDAFEAAVAGLHADLVGTGGDRRLVLDLSPMAPLVADAVGQADPRLVAFVETEGLAAVELGEAGDELPDLAGFRDRVDGLTVGATAVALGALALALAVAARRRRIALWAGLLVAAAGFAVVAVSFPASGLLVDTVEQDDMRAVADAVVGHLAASVRAGGLAAVAGGALLAVSAAWWGRRPRTALVR